MGLKGKVGEGNKIKGKYYIYNDSEKYCEGKMKKTE